MMSGMKLCRSIEGFYTYHRLVELQLEDWGCCESPQRVQGRTLVETQGAKPLENFEFLLSQGPLVCLVFVLLECTK